MDTAVSAKLTQQVSDVRRLFEERERGLAEQLAETRRALEQRDGEEQVPAEASSASSASCSRPTSSSSFSAAPTPRSTRASKR